MFAYSWPEIVVDNQVPSQCRGTCNSVEKTLEQEAKKACVVSVSPSEVTDGLPKDLRE